jgi:hypothetical protein
VRGFNRATDAFQHCFRFGQDFMVPETQHAESHRFETGASPVIVLPLFSVLSAIGLDNQLSIETDEIHNVRRYDHLTPELVSRQTAATEVLPQQPLGIGAVPAQTACAGTQFRFPHPVPLPEGVGTLRFVTVH